jgi:uncharacterized membrane protein
MKRKKIVKGIFLGVKWLMFLGIGGFTGWQGWLNNWPGIAALIVLLGFIVLAFEAIEKKFWPKAEKVSNEADGEEICQKQPEEKEPWMKVIVRTILQIGLGFCFAYGVLGLIMVLIGREENYALHIGLIAASIVLLIILLTVRPLQNQETKDELAVVKKDFKTYGKDERLYLIGYKAGYITLGITIMLLLVFGALIAVFPPDNFNIITMGILGIFGITVILYIVLYTLFDNEKLDMSERKSIYGGITVLIISLVPPILLAVRWILAGLSGTAIAFFAVFVGVVMLLAFGLWYERKYS